VFSPPDQVVDIRGRSRPARAAVEAESKSQPNGQQALPPTRGHDGVPAHARQGDGGREGQGGYTLAIIDSGLGMTAADIEAANRRLAGAESFTIAPSKYLGHYVAGNLAARHGITVRLDHSPGNGITATVHISPALLTTEAVTSAPVTPPHGMRPSGVALAGGGPALPPSPEPEPQPPWPSRPVPTPSPGWGPGEPATVSHGHESGAAAPRSVFDAPAAGEPEPSAWPPPPNQPTRTPSGLVKRPSRPGDGVRPAAATARARPDEDLLASLSRVAGTNRRPEQSGVPSPGIGPPQGPRGGNTFPPPGAPRSGPGDRGLDLRSTGPLGPPQAGPPPWPPPGSSGPVPPAPPLTRRVRGAQMPSADPMLVQRARLGGDGHQGAGSSPPPPSPAASDGRRSPDDVYSFLTSFTAGVQRGLDETKPPGSSDN
jgi:hypothetical protein